MKTQPNPSRPLLEEIQRLPTSGARAVEHFSVDGDDYLVIPQLAEDIAGQPAYMNGGNSDIDALVFRWADGRFVEHQRLPVPGGEDAEFFRIGDRSFLATASLRTGRGPYDLNAHSTVFEFKQQRFVPFQTFATFAAKQWSHFTLQGRHFLALAQGVVAEGPPAVHPSLSCLYEWNGSEFVFFQTVTSAWGYNWEFFVLGGEFFLGYADHIEVSRLLKWNGTGFAPFQDLAPKGGRAMCFFEAEGEAWLALANLIGESFLFRWDGAQFVQHQRLCGPGAREFAWVALPGAGHLIQLNFLRGERSAPQTALQSCIYRMRGKQLELIEEFPTFGAPDVCAFTIAGQHHVAVANSLSAEVRFRTDSVVYRLHSDD